MRNNRIKLMAVMIFVAMVALLSILKAPPTQASGLVDDPAVTYKAKCAACHTPNASKFYDATKSDEEHVQTILKGKKGGKPPYMPAFGEKGISEDDAKALASYMKGLRAAN
jgi:mono/diheme cytochrome c family protein